MRWDEVEVGDIVWVPKGTRRGPTIFKVMELIDDPLAIGALTLRGITIDQSPSWVHFVKRNDFTGFSVKGQPEFVNGEDE